LHPCRDVDGITESGEVDDGAPDVTHVRDACVDSHAHVNPRPGVAAVTGRFEQVDPGLNRAAPVVGTGDALHEEGHHLVADQLVDHRVMAQKRARRGDIEPVERSGEIGGDTALAERDGTPNVGEKHGDVDLCPAYRQCIATTSAQIRVLARRAEPDAGKQAADGAAERVVAQLASRRRGQMTKHVSRLDQRGMAVDQDLVPRRLDDLAAHGRHRREAPGRDRRCSIHAVASVSATADRASTIRLAPVPP
jgi:hypothetical protein